MEMLTQTERNEISRMKEEDDDDLTFVEICENYSELPGKYLKLIDEYLELEKRYDNLFNKIDSTIDDHKRVVTHNKNLQKENEELKNKLNAQPLDKNGILVFKDEECIICLKNKPNILFCICGHLCICEECENMISNSKCPKCRTFNSIKRKID